MSDQQFLEKAINLAKENVKVGGRPFGAVIVTNNTIIASGVNQIAQQGDPTAHAELQALRAASKALGKVDLADCTIYASGQPCPMCLAAIRMVGISRVFYAYSNQDAAPFGLSTEKLAQQLRLLPQQQQDFVFVQLKITSQVELYQLWQQQQAIKH
ncbi:nucleoside deaminase [Arsenophonus sp. aPb]|uniref:nucleoside deaminase n=1 Tax=Arsenophonus sp. aPb TaxID=3041619 RepID=UPI002469BE28|nr:nucleoside deaminase [Arsenophonus sp. aPb]WGL99607.1 nucleoside deaminase [Arsenophonus sp. aPb]